MATKAFKKLPKAAQRAAFAEMAKDAAGKIGENTIQRASKRYDKSGYKLLQREKQVIEGVDTGIDKVRKSGTNREFFTPISANKRITKTMFNRKWEAEKTVKAFVEYKKKKSK